MQKTYAKMAYQRRVGKKREENEIIKHTAEILERDPLCH